MAKVIPKRTLEDIRFRNDIADVISSYFDLKKAGSAYKALCPFHKEKTPSFHVNPQRQIYHCFGCGKGGDVFGFIMEYEGVDFVTAAKMLADRGGVVLELEDGDGPASEKPLLYKIHEEVAGFYQRCLKQMKGAEAARAYLEQRGLTGDAADEFLIGYAPACWDAVIQWGQKHKYAVADLEKAGLVVRSENPKSKSEYYDRFRDRLMFPIRDEQSRVVAFSGRLLDPDAKAAKYVNSPETALFSKSHVLYALDKARRNIVNAREAIICEGQIDVIRCHQAGFQTALAAQGTAFTEDHARIVHRYADSVCIVFDPDPAGQDAAIRAAELFMAAGLAVTVARLPAGEDPDSYIVKEGAEAFRGILKHAESVIGFQVGVLSDRERADSEVGVMRIAKAVLQTINRSPNAVQRARLIQEAAGRLKLPASALTDDLKYLRRREARRPQGEPAAAVSDAPALPVAEQELCEHLVHIRDFAELRELVETYLPVEMVSHPLCRTVVRAALDADREGRDITDVLRDLKPGDIALQQFAARLVMAPSKVRGAEISRVDAVKDLILYLWRQRFEQERAELERKMQDGGLTPEEDERRRHRTFDIKSLRNWSDGATIIEVEQGI